MLNEYEKSLAIFVSNSIIGLQFSLHSQILDKIENDRISSAETVSPKERESLVPRQFPAAQEALVHGLFLPQLHQRPLANRRPDLVW